MRDQKMLMMVVGVAVFAVACGGAEAPEPEPDMDMADAALEPTGPPRVFFVAPSDGDEISVDIGVNFEFGVENFEVSPVPEEVETPRGGMGHYHLGVDTDCLPVGEIVPQADPWIHFGDGSNTIEMQLEPGRYTFAVQMADDLHATLDGMCETIEIEVADGI